MVNISNLTSVEQMSRSNSLVDILFSLNEATSGWFIGLFMFILFFIMVLSFGEFSAENVLFSSFICFVISSLFWGVQNSYGYDRFIDIVYVILFLILVIITGFIVLLKK